MQKPAAQRTLCRHDEAVLNIILHLGAHKTASTYLQDRLAAAETAMQAHGTEVCLPSRIRGDIAEARAGVGRLRPILRKPRSFFVEAVAKLVSDAADRGVTRLVISEENILGNMDTLLLDAPFYHRAGARLADLMPVFDGHAVTLALSVRNYATFYASVWGFLIREQFDPFDQAMQARLMARQGEWPGLVQALQSSAPGVPVVIWKYEDFGRLHHQIFDSLVGPDAAGLIEKSDYRPLLGPSRRAVRRLYALAEEREVTPDDVKRVLRVQSKSKGLVRYDPWGDAARKALTQRYRRDVQAIAAQGGVRLLATTKPASCPPRNAARETERNEQ